MHLMIGWELGHGMGHIMPLRMLADTLLERGHELSFVVRDVSAAQKALADLPVTWVQAPQVVYQPWEMTRTDCYSQLLGNIGFRERDKLMSTVSGWRALIQSIQPDAALLEFAPSAMVACHIQSVPFAIQGNGFFCPPPVREGFGIMQPKMPAQAREQEDAALLATVNQVIDEYGGTGFDHISELYALARLNVIASFHELDHFQREDASAFHGVWVPHETERAEWPGGKGKRLFAYLNARPGVDRVLKMLSQSGTPTLVFCSGLDKAHRAPFESSSLRFLDGLVDLRALAREADLGIFHGNHSSTALFLLNGTPTLQLPLYMEQLMFARRVKALQAGELATLDQPKRIAGALNALVTVDTCRLGAQAFAKKYEQYDQPGEIAAAADGLESVLS
jgi:hypothetical protein